MFLFFLDFTSGKILLRSGATGKRCGKPNERRGVLRSQKLVMVMLVSSNDDDPRPRPPPVSRKNNFGYVPK